jgi:hypothetical protein
MGSGRKIAIVGSRGYPDTEAVVAFVQSLPEDTTIISGGAAGVDQIAETTARARGLAVISIPPNYTAHRRRPRYAPIARNRTIVEQADAVVVFWDGASKGSESVIRFCRERGVPCEIRQPASTPTLPLE